MTGTGRPFSSALCTAFTDALTAALAEHGVRARVTASEDGWYHVTVRGPTLGPTTAGGRHADICEAVEEIIGFVQVEMARMTAKAWPSHTPLALPRLPDRAERERDPDAHHRIPSVLRAWRAAMPEPHAALEGGVITAWFGEVEQPALTLPPIPVN